MKILNYGSLNYDLCYEVDHFTQAGETQSSLSFKRTLGGKGFNQSIALARAGLPVFHAGAVGKDGDGLKEYLLANKVDAALIKTDSHASTGHAVIQIADGENSILLYGGANMRISEEDIDSVLQHFEKGDLLILQNEISSLGYLMEKAHEIGMKIVFNAAPMNKKVFTYPLEHVDLIVVNEIEGRLLADSTAESNEAAAYVLANRFPDHEILMTSGEEGSRYIAHGEIYYQPAPVVSPVDTTGAGDTFLGYFLASRIAGKNVQESLKKATAASVLTISRKGAAVSIPEDKEVEESLSEGA